MREGEMGEAEGRLHGHVVRDVRPLDQLEVLEFIGLQDRLGLCKGRKRYGQRAGDRNSARAEYPGSPTGSSNEPDRAEGGESSSHDIPRPLGLHDGSATHRCDGHGGRDVVSLGERHCDCRCVVSTQ